MLPCTPSVHESGLFGRGLGYIGVGVILTKVEWPFSITSSSVQDRMSIDAEGPAEKLGGMIVRLGNSVKGWNTDGAREYLH
jgi:hypothetical protein